jgi:hypothetical protein
MSFFTPLVFPNLTMNCTHPNDKADIGCIRCSLMWMWNIVNFCCTCRNLVVAFQIAIGELTDEDDPEIPIMLYGQHRYISRNRLIDEYTLLDVGMGNALTLLKKKTATFFGLPGLAAFLRENEATYDSKVCTVINHDLIVQRQSVHVDEFKACGDYVNNFQDIKGDLTDIMHGMTIPGSGVIVKYVCVNDLVSALEDAVSACDGCVRECKKDGKFPCDFNPDDYRSVRAAIDGIMERA